MKKLVFLLSLFLVGIVHSGVPSIQDYKNKKSNNIYDSYIYGLESGIEWAYEHTYSKHAIEIYCKPRDLVLSAKQLRAMIDAEIDDNISFYTKYSDAPLLGLALRNAYVSSFSCN